MNNDRLIEQRKDERRNPTATLILENGHHTLLLATE